MILKKVYKVVLGSFLGISLFMVSGCGSDPEDKIIESFQKYYPDSFEKVAYKFNEGDKIGYLEFKAKNSKRLSFKRREYFKVTDENKSGYYSINTGYEDWTGNLEKSKEGNLIAKRKGIDDKVLDDFYEAAAKSGAYDMEDCINFYVNLHKKYGDILQKNDKSVLSWMNKAQWKGNSYVSLVNNYSLDGVKKVFNSLNSSVKEFRDYRDKAPDVVAKYFKGEVWDKQSHNLTWYQNVNLEEFGKQIEVQAELVDVQHMFKIGF